MRVKELFAFVRERQQVYLAREAGKARPWTKDSILQAYRFTNIYRENDIVTKWIATNWREPNGHAPDLWFAMVVARLMNWPPTLESIGYPVPWRPEQFLNRCARVEASGAKLFSSAYIVSTNGKAMPKPQYLVEYVLNPLWAARVDVRPHKGDTLAEFCERLMQFDGMGSFMAAQVIADVKYAKGSPLADAPDWHTWAASGPGSRRGLNRVCGNDKDAPWREAAWHAALLALRQELNAQLARIKGPGFPALHAQEVQNCLCEFDKYERVRLGEGRPRQNYAGA